MSHQQTFKISGVPVIFPAKPYPSQFCMMDRIIKGIERRQHCLLESPTGSGKSLALLCSSLAWLLEEKAKKDQEDQNEVNKGMCTCVCHTSSDLPKNESPSANIISDAKSDGLDKFGVLSDDGMPIVIKDDDEDEFKKDFVNFNTNAINKGVKKHISICYEDEEKSDSNLKDKTRKEEQSSPECLKCTCSSSSSFHRKIPKIFFGTRTHKQVAQIVRELKKTEYKDVKMTILGSREHTCIHPGVSKMKSKNEGCQDLLNGPGCIFKDKAQRFTSHQVIKSQGLSCAWDLEDLIAMCKPRKVCPYFLSRGLKDDADLVICPYNYLVDPLIREAMSLSLKGHIVILDEAHNIEDSAREAASQNILQESILAATKDMEVLMESHNLSDYSRLVHALRKLDGFIEENKHRLGQKDFNQSYKIWNGFHIVAELEAIGLGPKHFPDLKKALGSIKADAEDRKEEALQKGLNPNSVEMKTQTLNLLDQILMVMDFLYRQDLKYVDDYRASLIHSINYVPRHEENQWLNSRKKQGGRRMMQVDVINLNFWCMNPAVAFSDFAETRSVILTSGTLSPMASFQSELGLDFKIQLEANHVIKDSQVWVGTLGQGPNGTNLTAVYRNLETFAFQDELGQLILQVCKNVPHGVLCFLPSYKVLDKLSSRWECTGLLEKIAMKKKLFKEPRSSSKEDFEQQIASFYGAIDREDPEDPTDGAIMLAVCRGKISEGLDFADNYARAVISVGIPYPNIKDIQVDLKRKYNDQHRHDRNLLSGGDWYEIQAYRALNQALGRCIRHKNDWGALIIVDDRFVKNGPKYTKGLSKWVRNKVGNFGDYICGMDSLKDFIATRKKIEQEQQSESKSPLSVPVTPTTCPSTDANTVNSCQPKPNEDIIDNRVMSKSSKFNTPNSKVFPIFNLSSPQVSKASVSNKRNSPKLSAIARPSSSSFSSSLSSSSTLSSSRNPNYSHQVPTAVVHPSFILPPKPMTSISDTLASGFKTSSNGDKSTEDTVLSPHLNKSNICVESTIEGAAINPTTDPQSKPGLRIITEKAAPGTRTQVFEICPSFHSLFGGNLNLPVSSTERLVYLVEPPTVIGGNPLARIIVMSEDAKDEILKSDNNFNQKRGTGASMTLINLQNKTVVGRENIPNLNGGNSANTSSNKCDIGASANQTGRASTNQSGSVWLSKASALPVKPSRHSLYSFQRKTNDNTIIDCDTKISSVDVKSTTGKSNSYNDTSVIHELSAPTSQNCTEMETLSSPSLFDSPLTTAPSNINLNKHQQTPTSSQGQTNQKIKEKNISPSDPSIDSSCSKKSCNPLMKFFHIPRHSVLNSSNNDSIVVESKTSPSTTPKNRSSDNIESTCMYSSESDSKSKDHIIKTSPTNVENEKDSNSNLNLEDFRIHRKPLFKVNNSENRSPVKTKNEKNVFSCTSSHDQKNWLSTKVIETDVTKCDTENEIENDFNFNGTKTKPSNVRRSVSKSSLTSEKDSKCLESSLLGTQIDMEAESNLVVKRKCGRKKRKVSDQMSDDLKKRRASEEGTETQKIDPARTFQCITCGETLFNGESLAACNISHQKVPIFLRDTSDKISTDLDCIFLSSSLGHGGLMPALQGHTDSNRKYVPEEEIYIQFLYCSLCRSMDETVRPSGAKILFTVSANTRFTKGQLWLFSHAVSLSWQGKSLKTS